MEARIRAKSKWYKFSCPPPGLSRTHVGQSWPRLVDFMNASVDKHSELADANLSLQHVLRHYDTKISIGVMAALLGERVYY